jgi:hypothetical protein
MEILRRLKRLAAILRRERSNQPYRSSEEAYAQMDRIKALTRGKSLSSSGNG